MHTLVLAALLAAPLAAPIGALAQPTEPTQPRQPTQSQPPQAQETAQSQQPEPTQPQQPQQPEQPEQQPQQSQPTEPTEPTDPQLQQAPEASPPGEQPTPPIEPTITPAPLPPAVELPPPPGPPAPQTPLTAEEAARIALANQPLVAIASAGVEAARGRTEQARSALRPALGVGAGYTRVESLSSRSGGAGGGVVGATDGGGSSSGFRASATVDQLLFDFQRTRDLVRQSRSLERAAAANLTRVQSDLVQSVKNAFYAYLRNVRLVEVGEANLRSRQDQLALAQARLASGLGIPLDVVRAQTSVAEAVTALQQARNDASTSRVFLANLMGIDPRTPLIAAESGEPPLPSEDVNALVEAALRQRPEVMQAQASLEAARYGLEVARKTNVPTVSASAGVALRGNEFLPANRSLTLGVSLNWFPFDGGLREGRVTEAEAQELAARADLESARLTVTSEVSQSFLDLRTAEARVATAEAQVTNAEESVRLAEGRFRGGVGTFLEVTDAQAALLAARTDRVNALTAVDQARAALRRALGAPLPAP